MLRFDSFSKTVSAGLRVGYVTGPEVLVEKISQHIMATVMGGSSLSQVFFHNDLCIGFGEINKI